MKALNRKLLRDLRRLRFQAFSIMLLVGLGIAAFVSSIATLRSLVASADAFYARYAFADVFATVVRAPVRLLDAMREIDGVAVAEGSIVGRVRMGLPGFADPIQATAVSWSADSRLNQLSLRTGSLPRSDDEIVVNEQFADAHRLQPGAWVTALINGRNARLRISGIGISPEYVWIVPAGGFASDDLRVAVIWMRHAALARALEMEGSFTQVALKLAPGGSEAAVSAAVDAQLRAFGSFGATGRSRQPSHQMITQELRQLRSTATIMPVIFLSVAAFLFNVLLSRLIASQREQIAVLKALGYSDRAVSAHYASFALAIILGGAVLGSVGGQQFGELFIKLYSQNFRFPVLAFRLDVSVLAFAIGVSAAAGLLGASAALRRALKLPPAEAMRPEAPMDFRPTALERSGVHRLFAASGRMVLRDLERQPLRLALSSVGVAFATAVLVAGSSAFDSINYLMDMEFDRSQRQDVVVTFREPRAKDAIVELAKLPGILRAEGRQLVSVRIRAEHASRDTLLELMNPRATLRQLLDVNGDAVRVPATGVLLSRTLASRLHVEPGAFVEIEVLSGKRPRRLVTVARLIDDVVGLSAYMDEQTYQSQFSEPLRYGLANLTVDAIGYPNARARLLGRPEVYDVVDLRSARELFERQTAGVFLTLQAVFSAIAAAIATGVVYNNARIALQTRSRDLATLRILGYTKAEVARVLLGEQAVQLAVGIPLGLLFGRVLSALLTMGTDKELFRLPNVVSASTLASAGLVVLAAALLSFTAVGRSANRLDLVSVLKASD